MPSLLLSQSHFCDIFNHTWNGGCHKPAIMKTHVAWFWRFHVESQPSEYLPLVINLTDEKHPELELSPLKFSSFLWGPGSWKKDECCSTSRTLSNGPGPALRFNLVSVIGCSACGGWNRKPRCALIMGTNEIRPSGVPTSGLSVGNWTCLLFRMILFLLLPRPDSTWFVSYESERAADFNSAASSRYQHHIFGDGIIGNSNRMGHIDVDVPVSVEIWQLWCILTLWT